MKTLSEFINGELPDWSEIDPKAPRKVNFGDYDHYHHDREKCRICLAGRDHLRFCGRGENKRYWRGSFAKIHDAALELGGRGLDCYYRQVGNSPTWLLTLVEAPTEPEWMIERFNKDPMRF